MSEQPANAAPPATGRGGGSVFTQRLGPLPLWGWMGIGLAAALVYYVWNNRNQPSSSGSTSSSGAGTTNSNEVPQFVNQVYTQSAPPDDGNHGPVQVQNVPSAPTPSVTPYTNFADVGFGPVPGQTRYTVQVYTVNGNKQVYDKTGTATHMKITGLRPNTKYKLRVSVPGTGATSQLIDFKTKSTAKKDT